ncbi:MAG: hypothetical protein HKN39_04310 [Flavobacteriales bacterium]|nr:hypothetical protein [Flavobacteriales bacterium]
MIFFKQLIIVSAICLLSTALSSQLVHANYPMNKWSGHYLESELAKKDSLPLSAMKPYIIQAEQLYELPGFKEDTGIYYFDATHKLYGDNLIVIDKKDLFLTVDPILNLDIGIELSDPSEYADTAKFFLNTRGFLMRGSIGKKLSFETFFSENQLFVPLYQRGYMDRFDIAPGAGRHKPYQGVGYDLGYAGGLVSFQALPSWNLQFGHGKHFVGEGYRSVIFSDNITTYPYFRSSLQFFNGKMELTNMFASLQNLRRLPAGDSPESLFQRKAFSMNMISISPIKELRIGFIEGVMWQSYIAGSGDVDFEPRWLNPLPFFNSASLNWDEADNLFIGFDLAFKPMAKTTIYGQYLIDDRHTDRSSRQVGIKTADLFVDDLFLRVEYNESAFFTGAHEIPLQGLTHSNQPIAHPLGSGFNELIIQGSYKFDRWFVDISQQIVSHDKDVIQSNGVYSNFGVNPLEAHPAEIPEREATMLADLISSRVRIGYLFNPFNNFMAFLTFQSRRQSGDLFPTEKNALLSFGVKTDLFNHYYDF